MNASEYEQEGMSLMALRDWSGLVALSSEGLSIYPDEPELMCLKAYALRKMGRFQEAVDLLNVAVQLDPRPARYANRGYAFLAMGKTGEALADAEQAILLNSSYSSGHGLKAETLLAMGDYQGALAAADAALALDPGAAHYWHVKGKVLAEMGDCPGATASLEHSLSIKSDYDMPWPGLPNASVDLAGLQSACMTPEETAAPPRTALSTMVAVAALAVAVALMRR
jgi:tetratricopeptide (TPR) repeat protein